MPRMTCAIIATIAMLAIVRIAPRPGDTTLLVMFKPGTTQASMIDAVAQAGGRLVSFSKVPFLVQVHVEDDDYEARVIAAGALFVAAGPWLRGCGPTERRRT